MGDSDELGDSKGPGKLIIRVFICVDYLYLPYLFKSFVQSQGPAEAFTLRILSYHEAIPQAMESTVQCLACLLSSLRFLSLSLPEKFVSADEHRTPQTSARQPATSRDSAVRVFSDMEVDFVVQV